MLNIVLYGPPGAGKGTQSGKIIEKYGLVHASTGDMLRGEIAAGTQLGKEAKKYIDKGKLVPDDAVIGALEHFIQENFNPKGFVFDGFPRNLNQAESLDSMLAERGTSITVMIAIEVEEQELMKRLKIRGESESRSDDENAVIRNRLKLYRKTTDIIKSYYEKKGKFRSVDGIGTVEEIFSRICSVINEAYKIKA